MNVEFYIVNGFDRPCERLIAYKRADDLLNYANPDDNMRSHDGMHAYDATPLRAFGIETVLVGNILTGELVNESTATYSDTGKPRFWQGSQKFSVPVLLKTRNTRKLKQEK